MITKLLNNEEMSYILSLQQIFNTFFPGCSTQLRFPTGGFVLEVNIEMIPGTWRAWEEVVGHQTQPNHIWRFICSNISFNGIVGQYKIPKKSAQEETEAKEVAIPRSLSFATWLASLFWEIDVITCYFPVEAIIITFF